MGRKGGMLLRREGCHGEAQECRAEAERTNKFKRPCMSQAMTVDVNNENRTEEGDRWKMEIVPARIRHEAGRSSRRGFDFSLSRKYRLGLLPSS